MKHWILSSAVFVLFGCGVKGDPQPPETAPPIGRGEPDFSKAALIKSKKKINSKDIQDEWDKTPDFQDGSK